jgi:hypothetical protein
MHIMKNADEVFPVIPVLILLVLTPWPLAMMIASAIGLAALVAVLKGRQLPGAVLTAVVSFAVAAAIAIVLALSRTH